MKLYRIRTKLAKAVHKAGSADPLANPLRFDESLAPLAPRSPRLTGKYAKFDLRGGLTLRQIRKNDLPRYS
jgi:hypothetical protein